MPTSYPIPLTRPRFRDNAADPIRASGGAAFTWDAWGGGFDHVEPPVVERWHSSRAQCPTDAFPEFEGQPFRYGSRPLPSLGSIRKVTPHLSPTKFVCELGKILSASIQFAGAKRAR